MFLLESFRGSYWHVRGQIVNRIITPPSGPHTEGTEASTGQREPVQACMEAAKSVVETCMDFHHQNEYQAGNPAKRICVVDCG